MLIHIGYHKTGTTWLQNELFTGASGYRPVGSDRDVYELVVRPHDLAFDPEHARIKLAPPECGMSTDVMSSEILCGHPFYGGRESRALARRIALVAPNAKILVTIREQLSAIRSTYMQYVRRGGTLSPDDFYSGRQDESAFSYPEFDWAHFEYHRLVGEYQQLFGPQNVLVVTQEFLTTNREMAARTIGQFACNPIEPSRRCLESPRLGVSEPQYVAWLLRSANHLRRAPANPGGPKFSTRFGSSLYRTISAVGRHALVRHFVRRNDSVDVITRAHFAGRFGHSNRELASMSHYPIDLGSYEIDS